MQNTVRTKLILNTTRFLLYLLLNVIFYVLVIFAISKACSKSYEFAYQIFGDVIVQEAPGTDVDFQIKPGDSTMNIASKLKYNHLIVDEYSFYIRAKLTSSEGSPIVPGKYELNTSMTYEEILDIITDFGSEVREELE